MKNLIPFFIIIILIFNSNPIYCQKIGRKEMYAEIVIKDKELDLKLDSTSNLTISKKRHAKKIARMALFEKFGVIKVISKMPLRCINYYNYWIVWGGTLRKKYGGDMGIIIDGRKGCIKNIYLGK